MQAGPVLQARMHETIRDQHHTSSRATSQPCTFSGCLYSSSTSGVSLVASNQARLLATSPSSLRNSGRRMRLPSLHRYTASEETAQANSYPMAKRQLAAQQESFLLCNGIAAGADAHTCCRARQPIASYLIATCFINNRMQQRDVGTDCADMRNR